MKVGIRLKIDVSKIDKGLLYKGQKGTYLNVTSFVDLDGEDKYGNNGMITQDAPKDAPKGPILGNSKVFWRGESDNGSHQSQPAPQQPSAQDRFDGDIPF